MGKGSVLVPDQDRSEAGLFEKGDAGLFKRMAVHLPELQQVLRRYGVGVQAPFFERTSDLPQRIALHGEAESAPALIPAHRLGQTNPCNRKVIDSASPP